MLVESIAKHSRQSCVAPVVASIVDIVHISTYGNRQFVVDRRGIHHGYILLKSSSTARSLAKLCKHRCSYLHVESLVQSPVIPSSEVQRIVSNSFWLPIHVHLWQMQRVLFLHIFFHLFLFGFSLLSGSFLAPFA